MPKNIALYIYRTKIGSELDLVLVKGQRPVMAIETRMSSQPTLNRGNRIALIDLEIPLTLMIAPEVGDYPLDPKVRVCDLDHCWKYFSNL